MRTTAVLAFALCTACGSRTELGSEDGVDASLADVSQDVTFVDATKDVGVDASDGSVQDAEIDAGFDSGPQCTPNCLYNYQCELSCPPISTGLWCCDEQTNTCHAFQGQHCPNPIFDAGFD